MLELEIGTIAIAVTYVSHRSIGAQRRCNSLYEERAMHTKIFISYRRTDTASASGRIYERLVALYGKDNVFKDVDTIPAGVDFEHYIEEFIPQCAVLLVIIGR